MRLLRSFMICMVKLFLVNGEFTLNNLFLENENKLNANVCEKQLSHFQQSLNLKILWAKKMKNSWGNFPSGVFSGNLYDFGSFDQCINFVHDSEEVGRIFGQHCTLLIPHDRFKEEEEEEEDRMARFMPPSRNPQVNVGVGICIPASCDPLRVKEIADQYLYNNYNVKTSPFYDQRAFCSKAPPALEFNALQIFAM